MMLVVDKKSNEEFNIELIAEGNAYKVRIFINDGGIWCRFHVSAPYADLTKARAAYRRMAKKYF